MDPKDYKQWLPKLTPLPCPFCGKKPKVLPADPKTEGDAWGAVACVNKRCPAQPGVEDGSNLSDMRGPGAYKDMAIRRWNKRSNVKVSGPEGGLPPKGRARP